MTKNSKIEWCDHTFNPWIGCTKVSPACDNCYAESWDKRFTGGTRWGAGKPRTRTSEANWKLPLRWNREAEKNGTRPRVFCASLADVFDNDVPSEWRKDLFSLIRRTPHLDWLLLTKRIGNADRMIAESVGKLPIDENCGTGQWNHTPISQWPWPNVWLGATICNHEEADRDIPRLLRTSAAKRFVSIEPMLGEIDLRVILPNDAVSVTNSLTGEICHTFYEFFEHRNKVDWVIVGGETGKNARPMHPNWVRSLRDQCKEAGVPFFFKQWGKWVSCDEMPNKTIGWRFIDGQGYERTKTKNRELDGVIYEEYPAMGGK